MTAKSFITSLSIALCAIVLVMFVVSFRYLHADYRIFALLSSDSSLETLTKELGKPGSMVPAGEPLPPMGWPLPKLDRGQEIWIYDSISGRRFYVSINRTKNQVEHVSSSSS